MIRGLLGVNVRKQGKRGLLGVNVGKQSETWVTWG